RCEISSQKICVPLRAKIALGGSCLAISGGGGYKQNEPFLLCHLLEGNSKNIVHNLNSGFGDLAYQLHVEEAQKLVFLADDYRIKSFSWGHLNAEDHFERPLPVHTFNSASFYGPISVLPNDRVIRAGIGSVAVWDLTSQPDHGPQGRKRIGKRYRHDTYLEDCELSGGSASTSTISLQDSTFSPSVWEGVPGSPGSMICGCKNGGTSSCVVVDLEHGGTPKARFQGHSDTEVASISTSLSDPNIFVTGCEDGYARLFDLRAPHTATTFNAGKGRSPCWGIALAYPD
ncbi:hypothetical protein H0H93_016609, partial [Arthromyces matolae]